MKEINLALQLVGELSEATTKARRAVKGTRVSYILPILIIGMSEGLSLKEAVKATGLSSSNLCHRLSRICRLGYAYKSGSLYYLTERGFLVHTTVIKRIKPSLNRLSWLLVSKA